MEVRPPLKKDNTSKEFQWNVSKDNDTTHEYKDFTKEQCYNATTLCGSPSMRLRHQESAETIIDDEYVAHHM